MHRSGTSYVASVLQAAGISLGERLLGATFANVRGHFEDLDFTGLHARMLDAYRAANSGWTLTNREFIEQRFEADACSLIDARSQLPAWGWKDPRNTLFLDFWSRLLPEASFLFVYRKPWEVVDSLFRRGDAEIARDPLLSTRAWIEYNSRILRFVRACPQRAVLANVQGIAADVPGALARVRERLGYALAEPQVELFEKSFMRVLCRGSFEERAIATYAPQALDVYRELEAVADVKEPDSPDMRTAHAGDLAAPVMMHWQHLRSLETNLRLLHFRVDNATGAGR
jgi:hypothetical protein